MADLTCPKCQSPMRSYERSSITIDQCTGCRGVFLDRGELERLVDAEGAFYGAGGAAAGGYGDRPQRTPEPRREPRYEEQQTYGYGHGHRGKRHKREGFLGELFDF